MQPAANDVIDALTHDKTPPDGPHPDKQYHFGGGVVITEFRLPKGGLVKQHAHSYEHLSVLVSGHVTVYTELGQHDHYGHSVLTMPANIAHAVYAHDDSVWLCVHSENLPKGA